MYKKDRRQNDRKREAPEFEQRLVDIARVTRVMAGGKRLRFRACIVIGDSQGKISWGVAKGTDVAIAINKAVVQARKGLRKFNTSNGTVPHEVKAKFKSAQIFLKPAPEGRGIIAGGVVRDVLELAGIKDVIAKMYGSKNKINNVRCVFKALDKLKEPKDKEIEEPKNESSSATSSATSFATSFAKAPEVKKATEDKEIKEQESKKTKEQENKETEEQKDKKIEEPKNKKED